MSAGRRDKLITLRGYTATTDNYGGEVIAWTVLGQAKASVIYGPGTERRQAAQTQGEQAATFQMPSSEMARSVTLRDKIEMDGLLWNIRGIVPDKPKRGSIEFDALATGKAAPSG